MHTVLRGQQRECYLGKFWLHLQLYDYLGRVGKSTHLNLFSCVLQEVSQLELCRAQATGDSPVAHKRKGSDEWTYLCILWIELSAQLDRMELNSLKVSLPLELKQLKLEHLNFLGLFVSCALPSVSALKKSHYATEMWSFSSVSPSTSWYTRINNSCMLEFL